MSEYFPPKYESGAFHCPHCNVYANQTWKECCSSDKPSDKREDDEWGGNVFQNIEKLYIGNVLLYASLCSHCENPTLWWSKKIIYPPAQTFPPANSDLDDDVKKVYGEAAKIAGQSPRAACALLRLAVEMLLKQLGETGTINEGIKHLVEKGLAPRIQKALDIVRVTGNNALHPGQIGFDDDTDVSSLFDLINVIAEALLTQPKRIQGIYANLPEGDRKAIAKRDGKTE